MRNKIEFLINKGVLIENPNTLTIANDVDLNRIEKGAILNSGSTIRGERSFISKGAVIGSKGPVVIENCAIDNNAKLGSGYFSNSIFLKGSKAGGNSNVKEGTILEEKSSIAHSTGLKQTILFPYTTAGSLVNFCDCMMTGGTSPKNHSEVGSSFIHFNFTPNQDKATPSLMGNVFEGVFLDKDPIFLGGQSGMVGPVNLGFGTVTAAGSIIRSDELRDGRLIFESLHKNLNLNKNFGMYPSINGILKKNLYYIANLIALKNWYIFVKKEFLNKSIHFFLIKTIDIAINERLKRLIQLSDKVYDSIQILENKKRESKLLDLKKEFYSNKDSLKELIIFFLEDEKLIMDKRESFLQKFLNDKISGDYLTNIHQLSKLTKIAGVSWLREIVDKFMDSSQKILRSYQIKE